MRTLFLVIHSYDRENNYCAYSTREKAAAEERLILDAYGEEHGETFETGDDLGEATSWKAWTSIKEITLDDNGGAA